MDEYHRQNYIELVATGGVPSWAWLRANAAQNGQDAIVALCDEMAPTTKTGAPVIETAVAAAPETATVKRGPGRPRRGD
jgi:hypothetical protein